MIEFLTRAFGGGKSGAPKAGKRINLALQGGGALGAFTWGVLDHLLEDGRLTIEGISGASAGAVNAIILADGLARGGPEEARKRLADFWRAASIGGNLPEVQRRAVDRLFSFWPIEDTPVGLWMQALTRYLSPYDFNPLNINPLKIWSGASSISTRCGRARTSSFSYRRRMCGPENCTSSGAMK